MKQLKSTAEDLQTLFSSSITVKHIAEPLASFDQTADALAVQKFMACKHFDLIGVRGDDGQVRGYARHDDLCTGRLGEHCLSFESACMLDEAAPLSQAMSALRDTSACFVIVLGQVGGIVTRGDLQKAPVRMWLFGLITLLEMQMLRVIKLSYPGDGWCQHLSECRLQKAKDAFAELKGDNQELVLVDCLQFCDKREIILKTDGIWRRLRFGSRSSARRALEDLEGLRNALAHAQYLPHELSDRSSLWDLIAAAERALEAAERIVGPASSDPAP